MGMVITPIIYLCFIIIIIFINITGKLKLAFSVEASSWKKLLGSTLSINYKNKLMKISEYINEKNKVLLRPIKDLEDVRIAMKCLSTIRDDFITFDMELILIEETYSLMGYFNIDIMKEEQDIVDSLRFNFNNMLDMVHNLLCYNICTNHTYI